MPLVQSGSFGRFGLLSGLLLAAGCTGVIAPDPYLGTIDPNSPAPAGPFDPIVAFQSSTSNPINGCLVPRRGLGGPGGLDGVSWVYLGGLSPTQLDISNSSDPTRALPPSVYRVSGCNAPEGRGDARAFDARVDNYLKDRQYPVVAQGLVPAMAGAASEPTKLSTYKPFHVVVPVEMQSTVTDRMGCNDIKGERSLLERAGWSRETKVFPMEGPHDFSFHFPSRSEIRAGMATFQDWPMVNVAAPIMKTPVGTESCPFVSGTMARFPLFPGDPDASFQFPTQHWLRGLLGGYLDGGTLPTTTDPLACSQIATRIPTSKTCMTAAECDSTAGESCPSGGGLCVAPTPVCPLLNDLYVAVDEVPIPTDKTLANPIPSGTIVLKDAVDPMKTRTADILAIFSATPGQPGYSPVCRLRFFDKKKLACGRTEPEAIQPRPLCTATEIQNTAGAVVATPKDFYVHCLFLQPIAR